MLKKNLGRTRKYVWSLLTAAGAAFCLAAPACPAAPAQTPSAPLNVVLAKMDAASKTFRSAQADFRWDYYEKIVHDTTTQTGQIYFEREGATTDMAAVITDPVSKGKVVKAIQFKGVELRMFDPGVDQITVLNEASNQAQIESFLTLGFGGSGTQLAKAWNITDLGPETLQDDGTPVRTEKLDLVAKNPQMRKDVTHVTVWIDPARAIALKQVAYQSGGNYRTATYSHIRLNAPIDKGKFAFKTDKKTQTIQH